MSTLTGAEERIVRRAVRSTWQRFRAYMEYQDLKQGAYLWMFEHPEKVTEWADDGKRGEHNLEISLQRALRRQSIKAKAAAMGCKVDDFYQYRKGEIEAFLKGMFHNLAEAHARGARGDIHSGPNPVDPIPVELLDIQRAWKQLDHSHRELLIELLDKDRTEEQVAAEYEITTAALRKRKARALRRMQGLLNDGIDHVSTR